MRSTFQTPASRETVRLDWGTGQTVSSPGTTGARQLTILHAAVLSGKAHSFHKHPDQEEVLYVLSGTIEQWVGEEKRNMRAGDSVFIPAEIVHGTFNVGDQDAKLLAIFGPCVGDGFETVDMTGEAPWKGLRS